MEYNDKNQITKKTTTTKKSFEFSYDKNGNILDDGQKEYTYTPFGALLTSTNPTSSDTRFKKEDFKGYTSHEQYFDLNLINMKGRMYDPTIGRFLSPDIFIQSPTNSQSFNRYAYVWNNPLKYTDPSGYYLDDGDDDFDFSDPYDDTKTTTTNNNTNNNTKSNDGWDTADLYDDTGTNVVGTVDFNANTGEFMSQNTVDGSQEGRLGGYDYSVDADGQYTTQNLETGEKEAGWNTGSYHQYANGVETFTDSAIDYSGIAYKGSRFYTKEEILSQLNGVVASFIDIDDIAKALNRVTNLHNVLTSDNKTRATFSVIGGIIGGYIGERMGIGYKSKATLSIAGSLIGSSIADDIYNDLFGN